MVASKIDKSIIPPLSHLFSIRLSIFLLVRICVKTLRVTAETQWWYYGTAIPAVIDIVPADAVEKRMTLNSGGTATDVSQAVGSIYSAEAKDDVSGGTGKRKVRGEGDGFIEDSVDG